MTLVAPDQWAPQGVESLELGAWQALRETARSVCVTAGAGAGKTEFLAQKATYLLQTGLCPDPRRILAISFKRDAARNLAERVEKRCPPDQARRFDSVTFDAFNKGLVDRFRSAIPEPFVPPRDYRIQMPTAPQWRHFLEGHSIHGLNPQQIERLVARTALPFDNATSNAVRTYWDAQYHESDDAFLTFAMINRLVDYLLRENPTIRRALHNTYRFVFLDEFQDTTHAQYALLHTAFDGSNAVFTAVGDDKQRIMVWAGAMRDAFDRFEEDYDAIRIPLVSNWRSHEDLVRIQHVIAQRIDPRAEPPEAKAARAVDGDIAAIWEYGDEDSEAAGLAAWIAAEIDTGIEPHEIAILGRLRINDVENALSPALAVQGVRLRNVARLIGEIAIQDLLGEELTAILLPLLRLGAHARNRQAWNSIQRSLQFLEGIYPEDESGQQRLQIRLQSFVRDLRAQMKAKEPDEENVGVITQDVIDSVDPSVLRRAFPAYQREPDFSRVWEGFKGLLIECAEGAETWTQVLDRFEGLGQVGLMTIHKSKGLEFHTMIFYGLDRETWWSLRPDNVEELNSFFVALTRAKQRAFFTLCTGRGGPVAWIENLLSAGGVHRIPGPT